MFFHDADRLATIGDDFIWIESYTIAELDMTAPYVPNAPTYTERNADKMVVKLPIQSPAASSKLKEFAEEDERFAFRR